MLYTRASQLPSTTPKESTIHVRCLMLMGLRDATLRSRQLDQLADVNVEAMELPFEVSR